MQRLSAQKRWGKMSPEERSKVMSRVRAGEKGRIFMTEKQLAELANQPSLSPNMTPSPVSGGNHQKRE